MATLISAYENGHHRRCDAHCYNSKGDKCTCICGGANHGVGYKTALQNTREMAEKTTDSCIEISPDVINQQQSIQIA